LSTPIRLEDCTGPVSAHLSRRFQKVLEAPSQRTDELRTAALSHLGPSATDIVLKSVEIFSRTGKTKPPLDFLQPTHKELSDIFF
jgi:hypothetical protein